MFLVSGILPSKQPFLDRPGVLEDKAQVEASLTSTHLPASFLAASTQHSGDWLFVMPIASCGLRLDDEAARIAVGLRLGLDFCEPHQCHCDTVSYVKEPRQVSQASCPHDLIACSFASAGVPVTKEPSGLFRTDGKRPDGLTFVPWQIGR